MGFVIAFVAYRLCRSKRNSGEPFFGKGVHNFPIFYTLSNHRNDAKMFNTKVHSGVEAGGFTAKFEYYTLSRLFYDREGIENRNCCRLVQWNEIDSF